MPRFIFAVGVHRKTWPRDVRQRTCDERSQHGRSFWLLNSMPEHGKWMRRPGRAQGNVCIVSRVREAAQRRLISLTLSRFRLIPLVSYSRLLTVSFAPVEYGLNDDDEVGNNDDAVESSAAGGDSLAGSHELPSSGGLLLLSPEQE